MINEPVNIVRADVGKADLLAELSITTFRDTFGAANRQEDMDTYIRDEMNLANLTAELIDAENLFYIAWVGKEAAGYVKMRTLEKPAGTGTNPIEIERIYVRQHYLDCKIGAALMQHCMDLALSRNHDVVWLGVWDQNYRAVSFYKRWGFELFGSHPFVLGTDVQTDVLMKKELR